MLFRSLNITATPDSKVYDGTTIATVSYADNRIAGDVLTYSASASFADKNVANGIVVTVGGITTSGLDAGNYTVGSSTVVGNTANITPAPLRITANHDSRLAGAPYSGGNGVVYSGLVGGETAAVLTGALTYSGNSQGASAAGNFAITPGGQAGSNYAVTFSNGTLTLTPASATASTLSGFASKSSSLNLGSAYDSALFSFRSNFKSDLAAALGVDITRINVQSLNSAANDE